MALACSSQHTQTDSSVSAYEILAHNCGEERETTEKKAKPNQTTKKSTPKVSVSLFSPHQDHV